MLRISPLARCETYRTMSPGRISGVTGPQHAAPVTPLRMSRMSMMSPAWTVDSMASFDGNATMDTGEAGGSLMTWADAIRALAAARSQATDRQSTARPDERNVEAMGDH